MAIRVLIVDDHSLFRNALRSVLAAEPDILVLDDLGDAVAAIDAIERQQPDIVLLDISMPGLDGLDAARIVRNGQRPTRIIIVSMHADPAYVSRAMAADAYGYVLKEQAFEDLIDAVRSVHAGQRYFSPKLQKPQVINNDDRLRDSLTAREQEIVKMLAGGISAVDIAGALSVSTKTVETHRANIYRKLGLHNVVELTHFAIRSGMVRLG